MNRIDFYLIPHARSQSFYLFICRLVEKAYHSQHQVYIYSQNDEELENIDKLLWTFKDISFLPHVNSKALNQMSAPILLTDSIDDKKAEVLINLNTNPIVACDKFERIIEVVSSEELQKNISREKYKHYKSIGLNLKTHDLTK